MGGGMPEKRVVLKDLANRTGKDANHVITPKSEILSVIIIWLKMMRAV